MAPMDNLAALKSIDGVGRNILTAEEPIEYVLPRASQVAVNRAIGLGFAEILRAFMLSLLADRVFEGVAQARRERRCA